MFKIFENAYYYFVKISENLEITVPISVETQLQIDLETIIDVPHHLWQFLSINNLRYSRFRPQSVGFSWYSILMELDRRSPFKGGLPRSTVAKKIIRFFSQDLQLGRVDAQSSDHRFE